MSTQRSAFVDESRRGPTYKMCAALIVDRELEPARKALRAMRAQGQRRIHFATESDRQRRRLLAQMAELELSTIIYSIRHPADLDARSHILRTMVPDLRSRGVRRLVLESRESQDPRDRADLYRLVGPNPQPVFAYSHQTPTSEPLLWIPDAVAWAWGRGGGWRRRLGSLGLIDAAIAVEYP